LDEIPISPPYTGTFQNKFITPVVSSPLLSEPAVPNQGEHEVGGTTGSLYCCSEGVARTAKATSGVCNFWMSVSQLAFEAASLSVVYGHRASVVFLELQCSLLCRVRDLV
jgi:hypothetical protein